MKQMPPDPDWAFVPSEDWTMESTKGGVVSGIYKFREFGEDGQTRWTMGRGEDADIEVSHPSCSRLHCIVTFAASGPRILDLGSTHGTKVCGKKIPRGEWIELSDGMWCSLGEGERRYVFSGPREEEEEEEEEEEILPPARTQQSSILESKSEGDIELAKVLKRTAEKNLHHQSQPTTSRPTSKKALERNEKMARKKSKLQNLTIESDRIEAKRAEDGGLSKGQEEQLMRNEEKMTNLRLEIEIAEAEIEGSNQESNGGRKKKRGSVENNWDVDGDDDSSFYDRTITSSTKADNEPAHTFASLFSKRKALLEKSTKAKRVQEKLQNKFISKEGEWKGFKKEEGDPLEIFMMEEAVKEASRGVAEAEAQVASAKNELVDVEKLLDIADSKWRTRLLPEAGAAAAAMAAKITRTAKTSAIKTKIMGPPPGAPKPTGPPPSKKLKVSAMPPPPPPVIANKLMPPPPPPMVAMKYPKSVPNSKTEATKQIETWQAPAGQTGDGKTKLNEKFAGRY